MKNVALIVYGRFPTEKAYGSHLIDVANGFISNKVAVSIIYSKTSNDKTIYKSPENYYASEKIKYIEANNFDFTKLDFFKILPNILKKVLWSIGAYFWSRSLRTTLKDYDTIWSTNPNTLIYHANSSKTIIYEKHGAGKKIQKVILKRLSKFNNIYFVGTTRTSFEELSNLSKSKSIYLTNGVNLSEYKNTKINTSTNKLNVGYIGMLETYGKDKGVKDAFQQIKKLPDAHKIKATLVGGPKQKLDEIVNEFKDSKIEFSYSDKIPKNEVPNAMKKLDIGIVPYPEETHMTNYASPMKIFEYAASNTVVLASDIKSNFELQDTDLGIIYYKAGDFDDFRNKLLLLINNAELRNKLLLKSQRSIENYSLQKRFQTLIDFCVRSSNG